MTAGNASGLTDGATGCLLVAAEVADELGLPVRMRMVAFAFAGVDPETMGTGPIPATEKALAKAGLTIDDIGLIEINEAFAVQVLAFTDHFGLADDDERVNQYGGAIAMGHPLASSGVRLMTQLARQFAERPDVQYGLTTMCVGLGMGGTVIWENPHYTERRRSATADRDDRHRHRRAPVSTTGSAPVTHRLPKRPDTAADHSALASARSSPHAADARAGRSVAVGRDRAGRLHPGRADHPGQRP